VQPAAAALTLPPPPQQPMPHLPMLLLSVLRQICCHFHDPRAQPNLQPPEMRPNCEGGDIFKETRTTYYLFSSKIHVHPEKIN
jgi:hypothetical protein